MNTPSEELAQECKRLEESCLYTSTSLFIWLRLLRCLKIFLIIAPIILGALASLQLLKDGRYADVAAVSSFLAGLLSSVYAALKLDKHIEECVKYSAEFKNLQDEFRRAANVVVYKPFGEFEDAVKQLTGKLENARLASITPPEWVFWLAQRKVKSGDYSFDADATPTPNISKENSREAMMVEGIEKRFDVVLTMTALFPIMLATYFIIANGNADAHSQTVAFGYFGLVAIYLASYVVFQFIKLVPVPKWTLVILNWVLLAGIACFIMPIIATVVIAAKGSIPLSFSTLVDAGLFIASMWGMVYLSFGVLLFSGVSLGIGIAEYISQRRNKS